MVQRLHCTRDTVVLLKLIKDLQKRILGYELKAKILRGKKSYRASQSHIFVKSSNKNILLVLVMVMLMFRLDIDDLGQDSAFFSPLLRGGPTKNVKTIYIC